MKRPRILEIGVAAATAVCLSLPGTTFALADAGARAGSGGLPQTSALPSAGTPRFRTRVAALWRGIVIDSPAAAMPAFFPREAYLQLKQMANPLADYRQRLLGAFRLDVRAAHALLGRGAASAKLLRVSLPRQWAWIRPGYCYNRIGYWHAPGARLVYEESGRIRSFGIFSLISWRGEWYVIHLAVYDHPGTVDGASSGVGAYGPPGGC